MIRASVVVVVFVCACFPGCVSGTADEQPPKAVRDLRINEVAAKGDPVDWFEVVNVGGNDIVLDGVSFSDDPAVVDKGGFDKGAVVSPGEFVVVQVDDADVGFKLGSDEELHLFARDNGALIDEVDWDEGESPSGGSLARVPDGDGEFVTAVVATEGATNGE